MLCDQSGLIGLFAIAYGLLHMLASQDGTRGPSPPLSAASYCSFKTVCLLLMAPSERSKPTLFRGSPPEGNL